MTCREKYEVSADGSGVIQDIVGKVLMCNMLNRSEPWRLGSRLWTLVRFEYHCHTLLCCLADKIPLFGTMSCTFLVEFLC